MTEPRTIFGVPCQREIVVFTASVGIVDDDRSLTLDRRVRLTCKATDDFDTIGGKRRRRFTDCTPPIGMDSDVWLADAPIVG